MPCAQSVTVYFSWNTTALNQLCCWEREEYFKYACIYVCISSVQFSSVTQLCPTLRPHGLKHARPPCPSPTPGVYSKLMSIELVMASNHLILCHPLLLLPPIPPSIRVLLAFCKTHHSLLALTNTRLSYFRRMLRDYFKQWKGQQKIQSENHDAK